MKFIYLVYTDNGQSFEDHEYHLINVFFNEEEAIETVRKFNSTPKLNSYYNRDFLFYEEFDLKNQMITKNIRL